MVGARLVLGWREDAHALSEAHEVLAPEKSELPLDEAREEGVEVGGEEGAAVVDLGTEAFEVCGAFGGEVFYPFYMRENYCI